MASQRKLRKIGDSSTSDENSERNNDEEIQKALEEIDSCQNELDSLNELASHEILKIEQKYNVSRKPYFEKRNDSIRKIPHFWVTAFVNHPDLSTILTDPEEDCLHHLQKIEVEEYEDILAGFRIHLYFEDNPYFENRILTKEYNLRPQDPSSKSTPIKWKEGFDLQSKQSNSSKVGVKRASDHKSFFSWFNDHTDPASDDIAEIIKDDIYVNPLQYFLVPDVNVDNSVADEEGSEQEEDDTEEQDTGNADDSDEEDTPDVQNSVSEDAASP